MKNLLTTISLVTLLNTSAFAAELPLKKPMLNKSTPVAQIKKKDPNGCKAFGNAVRNIRTVKEMQREMEKHSDDTIKKCAEEFKSDPKIMRWLKMWAKINRS